MHNVNTDALEATTEKARKDPTAVVQEVVFDGEWQTEEGRPQFRSTIPFPNGETVFEADFPPPMGGTGAAPNPLAYCFWGGLACYAMTFAQEAAKAGVEIQSLRARAHAEVDQSRALGVTDNRPSSGSAGISRWTPMRRASNSSSSSAWPTSAALACGAFATLWSWTRCFSEGSTGPSIASGSPIRRRLALDMDMSTGWVVFAILMMVVMMGGMGWMMVRMSAGAGKDGQSASDPLEILRERYARGEISEEEYQRGRRALRESDGS